jgi:hypothetical protein
MKLLSKFISKIFGSKGEVDEPRAAVFPVKAGYPINQLNIVPFDEINPNSPTIFLSFDGTLHRHNFESFDAIPKLELLIEQHPNIQIVITSDWRLVSDAEILKGVLGDAVWCRVIGTTPTINDGISRQFEIQQIVNTYGLTNYVAIDDRAKLFDANCHFLLKTDDGTGLTNDDFVALKQWLIR